MGRIPAGVCPAGSPAVIKGIAADEKGVLLADLLASLALGLAVLVLVINMLMAAQSSSRQQSIDAELLYAGQVVQQVLMEEVRNAQKVKVINGGKKLLVTNAGGGVTGYYSNGGSFYREYITANPIAENVQALHFSQSEDCLLVDVDLVKEQDQLQISFACAVRCE